MYNPGTQVRLTKIEATENPLYPTPTKEEYARDKYAKHMSIPADRTFVGRQWEAFVQIPAGHEGRRGSHR